MDEDKYKKYVERIEKLGVANIGGGHVKIETFNLWGDMNEQKSNSYDLSNARFGGGFAAEGGLQVGGTLLDISSESANLSEVATEIEKLLQQLKTEGITVEEAQQQVAKDLAKQAENNPTVMVKLVQWGKSLADTTSKTTVNEAVKGVVKLSLQMIGIPLG